MKYWRFLLHTYLLRQGSLGRSWRSLKLDIHKDYATRPADCPYPLDFSGDLRPDLLTDGKGIPMVDYATLGRHYNPWFTGHIALGLYSRHHHNGNARDLEDFRRLALWFVSEARETRHGLAWHYDFDWFGGQKKPWHSALAQAHAISVLLRAARTFDEASYTKVARAATHQLIAPLQDGGCAHWHEDGSLSFEEYAQDPPITVLNGHLFASLACREAALSLGDEDFARHSEVVSRLRKGEPARRSHASSKLRHEAAKNMQQEELPKDSEAAKDLGDEDFTKHSEAAWRFVRNRLADYDMGFWSKYSLKKIVSLQDISSVHYHKVHILLLKVAAAIRREEVFGQYAGRFEDYLGHRGSRRKALWHKRLTKLLWDWK